MRKSVVVVLFAAILGGGVVATEQPQLVPVNLTSGPGGGFGDLYLLGQKAVQDDLRLNDRQLDAVHDSIGELIEKQQVFRREADAAKKKELAEELVRTRLRYDRQAAGLLTPSQAERLQQISLRVKSTASFWDPEIRRKLDITDEQFGRMKTLAMETYSAWNKEVEAEFRKNKDFPAYQKKLEENRKRRDREQVAVLTPEQRAKWDRMIGEPFDGPIPSPILVRASTQAPSVTRQPSSGGMRIPQVQSGDSVEKLAGVVATLAQEITRLNQETRRLQQENDRLRAEIEQLRAQPGKKAAADGRFLDRGDYVEDTKTGLLWQKHGTASGKMNYYDAIKYATTVKLGGHYGWRVPTKEELAAIFPATDAPFTDTKYNEAPFGKGAGEWNSYWTSNLDDRLPDYAYVYHWYAKGGANNCIASKNFVYVRCVHDPVKK